MIDYLPVLLVAAWALGARRYGSAGGWLGVACFFASAALARSFTLAADVGTARAIWHLALGATALMYAGVHRYLTGSLSPRLILPLVIALGYTAGVWAVGDPASPYQRHGASLALLVTIAAATWLILGRFDRHELFERLAWAILAVAETFAVVEFVLCQAVRFDEVEAVLRETWGVEASKYACGRAFGEAYAHAPLALTTLALAWVIYRYPRRRGGPGDER